MGTVFFYFVMLACLFLSASIIAVGIDMFFYNRTHRKAIETEASESITCIPTENNDSLKVGKLYRLNPSVPFSLYSSMFKLECFDSNLSSGRVENILEKFRRT